MSMNLAEKVCVPCTGDVPPLKTGSIEALKPAVPGLGSRE